MDVDLREDIFGNWKRFKVQKQGAFMMHVTFVGISLSVSEFDCTGSMLIVNCNITDTRDNTNPRCWRVNNTLVDDYYGESKRIQEGIEWVSRSPGFSAT